MKKIFFLLTASVAIISCSKVKDGEYLITGTATGIENGKTIILQGQDPTTMMTVALDTVKVENGKFEIKGKVTEPAFHTLILQDANAPIPFILETGEITIAIDKDSIHKTKIAGTYNNDEFVKFNDELTKTQKRLIDFQKNNTQKMQTAQQTKDTAVINGLMKEYMTIQTEVQEDSKKKYVTYAESHPKSFISTLIIQGMVQDPSADMKKAETLYNSLDESLKTTSPGKKIKEKLGQAKMPSVGATAPAVGSPNWRSDFSAPNPEGKTVSLKESLGKVTIVDFWASWCGPCRQENPHVVAIYKELHSKGLNIIGVSLDKDATKWKEAIAKDGLTWTQVSHLKFWDEPIAAQYGVQSIPATFILDASGKVVAQDLRGDELRAKVLELLAKK
jgi:thiol-disulfide isomerase/thioredoxin